MRDLLSPHVARKTVLLLTAVENRWYFEASISVFAPLVSSAEGSDEPHPSRVFYVDNPIAAVKETVEDSTDETLEHRLENRQVLKDILRCFLSNPIVVGVVRGFVESTVEHWRRCWSFLTTGSRSCIYECLSAHRCGVGSSLLHRVEELWNTLNTQMLSEMHLIPSGKHHTAVGYWRLATVPTNSSHSIVRVVGRTVMTQ
jgi:hypothetical protein